DPAGRSDFSRRTDSLDCESCRSDHRTRSNRSPGAWHIASVNTENICHDEREDTGMEVRPLEIVTRRVHLADLVELTKPRITFLVLITTLVGFYMGSANNL